MAVMADDTSRKVAPSFDPSGMDQFDLDEWSEHAATAQKRLTEIRRLLDEYVSDVSGNRAVPQQAAVPTDRPQE